MSLHALGGSELRGDNLVRFVYLDESGIANPEQEPYTVVAGVMVHADKHWKAIETYLLGMVERFVPLDKREGFFFSGKDLHHGSGHTPRERYPRQLRIAILHELCEIPRRFDLPIVAGFVKRAHYASFFPSQSASDLTVEAHLLATVQCAACVEIYMRAHAEQGEVATMVYENNDNAKQIIRKMHNFLRSSAALDGAYRMGFALANVIPFQRIVDTAHFAEKLDTSLLQIADACAFGIKRHLMEVDDENYFGPMAEKVFRSPDVFESSEISALSSSAQFS
jgi:Protein of unknown function (DUF3800)